MVDSQVKELKVKINYTGEDTGDVRENLKLRNKLMTKVVNINRKETYDVYIGRGSKWGNPFKIGPDGSREQVIRKYGKWIMTQPNLLNSLHELKGKRLGCFCSPDYECHGNILIELIKGNYSDKNEFIEDLEDEEEVQFNWENE